MNDIFHTLTLWGQQGHLSTVTCHCPTVHRCGLLV